MATVLGSLLISLGLESGEFSSGVAGVDKEIAKATKKWEKTGEEIGNWGKGLTAGLTLPLGAFAVASVQAAQESRDAMGQVEAALKSMGNAAGFTADQLGDLAATEMNNSLYDDDEILRKVTANMLTFGKISGEQFKRAQSAAVDLAARLGGDLQGATMMVGKALNDPVKGLAALGRAGIQFTEQQKEMIKSMVAAGDAAGAQKIMLAELENQFGGSAEAARKADPAAAMKVSWADLQETVGAKLLPIFQRFADMLTGLLDRFNNLSPGMQSFIIGAGALAAALGPVLMAVGAITSGIAPLLGAITAFTPALGAAGAATSVLGGFLSGLLPILGPIALAVGAAYLAWKNWDTIGPILDSAWESINKVLGPALKEMISSITGALSSLWNGPFGSALKTVVSALGQLYLAYAKAFGPVVLQSLASLAKGVGSAFATIGSILNAVAALLTGDFSGAWGYLKDAATNAMRTLGNVINAMVPGALSSIANLVTGVRDWIVGKLGAIWQGAIDKINIVKGAFFQLYDAVVGHSYVPDMVDEIGQHISRLNPLMVVPVKKMTAAASEAFKKLQDDARAVFDRLFPEQAQMRGYAEDELTLAKALKEGLINARQYADALYRLNEERGKVTGSDWNTQISLAGANDNPLFSGFKVTPEMLAEVGKVGAAAKTMADDATVQTVRVAESFKDMVDKSLSALRSFVDGIKKGDILSIVEGIWGMFSQLGSMGVFGKNIQSNLKEFGGFKAAGGPVMRGKSYIVGERGPEMFTPSRSGSIIPNHELGGRSVVEIVPTPYFNAVVDGRAQGVVGQAAPGIASATSSGLQSRAATQNMRRLA